MSISSKILVSSLLLVQVIADNESSGKTSLSSPSSTDGAHTETNSSSPQSGSSGPPQYNPVEQAAMQVGNMQFGGMTLIILASVAAVFLLYRIAISTVRSARVLSCVESDKQTYWRQSVGWFAQIKKHLLYAPLLKKRHQAEMQLFKGWSLGVLPTRFQSLFLVLLIAMNIIYCVLGIEWNSVGSTIMLGHLRNRTGTIAVVNMIPLVLLAGRNNPLIILLNIPYGSFNMVHRWLGRIVVAESVVHTSCFIAGKVYSGGWKSVSQSFMAYGQIPQTGLIVRDIRRLTCFLTLTCLTGFLRLRSYCDYLDGSIPSSFLRAMVSFTHCPRHSINSWIMVPSQQSTATDVHSCIHPRLGH